MIAPVITTNGMSTIQNLFITASVTGIQLFPASLSRAERAAYDGRHRRPEGRDEMHCGSTPQEAASGPEGECLVNVRVLIAVLAAGAVVATAPRHLAAARQNRLLPRPSRLPPRLVLLS